VANTAGSAPSHKLESYSKPGREMVEPSTRAILPINKTMPVAGGYLAHSGGFVVQTRADIGERDGGRDTQAGATQTGQTKFRVPGTVL